MARHRRAMRWRSSASPVCDVAPVDLSDPVQALRLKSYVWADATRRMARLDAAVAMAGRAPPELVRRDAVEFVEERLAKPQAKGVTRALFHTVMWQYLTPAKREAITAADGAGGGGRPPPIVRSPGSGWKPTARPSATNCGCDTGPVASNPVVLAGGTPAWRLGRMARFGRGLIALQRTRSRVILRVADRIGLFGQGNELLIVARHRREAAARASPPSPARSGRGSN